MTIPRNLSKLAEGADTSGVLGAANGGTGLSSPGTSGNILTSNGTGWVSSALPSSGAFTLISSQTSGFSWTGLSGYGYYMLEVALSSNASSAVYLQTGYGSTPTWITSSYSVAGYYISGGSVNAIYENATLSGVQLNYGGGGVPAGNGCYSTVYLNNISGSGSYGYCQFSGSDSYPENHSGIGKLYTGANSITAIRLSGTSLTGKVSLYGISF